MKLYEPKYEDLWFRRQMLEDEETMSYNHHWGGTVSFPRKEWQEWFDHWIVNHDNRRCYRYLQDEDDRFIGEVAYHYYEQRQIWTADMIIYAPLRGQGYGSRGLEMLCKAARQAGIEVLYDDIAIDNPAIGLFRKHGFVEEYRTDEIIMLRKDLGERKGNNEMILETERLKLRHWQSEDAAELYRYASDPRVGTPAGWPAHRSEKESRIVFDKFLSNPTDYAIIWKQTNLPIGAISLKFNSDLASGDEECELGYWLGVPYWGRGIMPEAGREMLRHAFEDLNMKRVWCGYYEGNDKSRRVQEKLHFRYHHTSDEVEVAQLHEKRCGVANLITREQWLEDRRKAEQAITVNIYYTGEGSAAVDFMKEMESSGIAGRIRAEEGNLRYEYFLPSDDPQTVLLIDSWKNQEALDRHHATEMMQQIVLLREKYDLHMRVERFINVEENESDGRYIRK